MSSPPNFLGMALGYIAQQRQRQEEQDRRDLIFQREKDARRQQSFANALTLIQHGTDPNAAIKLYADDLGAGQMDFLKSEGKLIQKQAEQKALTPGRGAQTDIAQGIAAFGSNPQADPLRAALSQIAAAKQIEDQGAPRYVADQLLQRGAALGQIAQAKQAAETRRVTELSNITEARHRREAGVRASLRAGKAGQKVPLAVQSAWAQFQASGKRFEDWSADTDPKIVDRATQHPDYIARQQRLGELQQAPIPVGVVAPGLVPRSPGLVPPAQPIPAPLPTPAPTPIAGGWVDIGGGIRVRKK